MRILPNGTESSLSLLAGLIHERTGLFFDPSRWDLMADKLNPLMVEKNLSSVQDYYYYLRYDDASGAEWQRVHSALAVNETYFWREFEQIRAAVEILVPRYQKKYPGKPIRIWHAACASGEEPYTMAIALTEAGCYRNGPIDITGTDFNPVALSLARAGLYRQRSFRNIPVDILNRYFVPEGPNHYRIDDAIRARVNFSYHNLMGDASGALLSGFHMIYCRNAFIYFSDQAIEKVLEGFYRALNPDGYLFVASAESLLRLDTPFDLVEVDGAFGYRK